MYDKSSSTLLISNIESLAPKVPYSTTRITHSPFSYSFLSSPGLMFIRIYFLSSSYQMMNPSKAYFFVKASPYTLVSDFNPFVFAEELNLVYFTKDFLVNIREETLTITYTPSPLIPNAFAFVNGIEIFLMPLSIYFPSSMVPYLGHQEPLFISDEYALEMLYQVSIASDVENAFGTWLDDSSYISGSQSGSVLSIKHRTVSMNYTTLTSKDYNYLALA